MPSFGCDGRKFRSQPKLRDADRRVPTQSYRSFDRCAFDDKQSSEVCTAICIKGIFVCTTNLLDRIDQAALRRFTFKIKFKPLTPEQRENMFVTEALAGEVAKLDADLKIRLAKLEVLCPGDFAAVKRQIDILGEGFTAGEFMSQLEAEHRIKPEVREARSIGFLQ